MTTALLGALRFARHWSSPRRDLEESEVEVLPDSGEAPVPATLVTRPGASPRRGWVVLHGLTRPGRRHPELVRFVRALASAGGRVLVPEIRAWTRLRFEPQSAQGILRGAVLHLSDDPHVLSGGVNLVAFSFGGPQALLAASDPDLAARIRGLVAWGGYEDLERTVTFHFTGEHEWEGERLHLRPDPYGRWVVGANCLTLLSGYEDREEVAAALHRLASEAGERQVKALDPSLEPLKPVLRGGLPSRDRALFDLFAPPRDRDPDPEEGRELARQLAEAARREMPLLDPIPGIERLIPPIRLLHGRGDRLIPYTETLSLDRRLRPRAPEVITGLTGLFTHSGGSGTAPIGARIRESLRFLGLLARVFELA